MNNKDSSLTKKFGMKVRLERTKRELTQAQLGELSGLSANHIGTIERGENATSIEALAAIAKAFGMNASELIDVNKFEL